MINIIDFLILFFMFGIFFKEWFLLADLYIKSDKQVVKLIEEYLLSENGSWYVTISNSSSKTIIVLIIWIISVLVISTVLGIFGFLKSSEVYCFVGVFRVVAIHLTIEKIKSTETYKHWKNKGQ